MRMAYLGALIGVSLAIGCGGGDDDEGGNADRYEGDEADVAAVVDDFAEAGREGDGARVCDEIFAVALARNVEREAEQSCATEVESQISEGEYELTVNSVELDEKAASVAVTDQNGNSSVLQMVRVDDDWRVGAVQPTTE